MKSFFSLSISNWNALQLNEIPNTWMVIRHESIRVHEIRIRGTGLFRISHSDFFSAFRTDFEWLSQRLRRKWAIPKWSKSNGLKLIIRTTRPVKHQTQTVRSLPIRNVLFSGTLRLDELNVQWAMVFSPLRGLCSPKQMLKSHKSNPASTNLGSPCQEEKLITKGMHVGKMKQP